MGESSLKQRIKTLTDPRYLFNTISTILVSLFDKEEAYLTKQENTLIDRNIQEGGSYDGFRHNGRIHTHLTGAGRSRGKYGPLMESLMEQADSITDQRAALNQERDRIKQAFTLVLRNCRSPQDIRDALPNSMSSLIPECERLERTRPEAFTLADNPRSYAQYMQLREKIEFYVASRLLY